MINTVRKIWENSNIIGKDSPLSSLTRFDVLLSDYTTFKVGGPADIFIEPNSQEELLSCLEASFALKIPVYMLGGGANVVISDAGIRGIVISTAKLSAIFLDSSLSTNTEVYVYCESGCPVDSLAQWCAMHDIGGLERFASLPGSVGGAVFMNARCYEASISDVFYSARCLKAEKNSLQIENIQYESQSWDYKKSPFQSRSRTDPLLITEGSTVILSTIFKLYPREKESILTDMATYTKDRHEKGHFRYPSAGSMFKNNHLFGKPSGKIIDEAGLRGFSVGDAAVAPFHGNIVINKGKARASDILTLVSEVRRQVYEKTGFLLETEVIFSGDWTQQEHREFLI